MSEKTPHPAPSTQVGAKLVNLYKPVGIAALNAAALCVSQKKLATKGK
ncbi:MAG: hypothetical protein Tsb0019_33030 [Roseibium sp.]